jgi:uncharacterized protein YbaP (TraB family)
MKLRHGLLVTLVALASTGAACKKAREPTPEPAPAPAPAPTADPAVDPWQGAAREKDPLPRPFLWTAEKDGATTYLLGTMHVGVDPETRLPQLVWDKLDAAAAFAVETDVTDPAITRFGGRKSGTLRDELGPAYWKQLELALTPQIAEALVHKSAAIPATLLALRGLPPTPPMDGILLARAKNRGKRIAYLEPAARQAALLEEHMNAKALKLMLDDLDKTEQQGKQLLAAYIAGDEARCIAITDEQRRDALAHGYTAAEYDESLEDLLYRRNASWIAPIEKLHAAGGAFIAVGAMHLIGKRSVLELLEARGYRIARVAGLAAPAPAPTAAPAPAPTTAPATAPAPAPAP